MNFEKVFGWVATPFYIVASFTVMVVTHPFVWIGARFSAPLFWKAMMIGARFLILSLRIVGTRVQIRGQENLPQAGPVLIISNHQSDLDIPLLAWVFRKVYPRFVAKDILGRGIPSISLILRYTQSALIDRSDRSQALTAIADLATRQAQGGFGVCLFPEGTRSRDGVLKPFKFGGATTILKSVPNALIVPVAIDGMWKLLRFKGWPVPWGQPVTCTILPGLRVVDGDTSEALGMAEHALKQCLQPEHFSK